MWKKGFHSFNMVDVSPWPLLGSLAAWSVAVGLVVWFWSSNWISLSLGVCSLCVIACLWWRDVVREATYCGCHTNSVRNCLYSGVVMFIVSEVMFFFSFFFGYFFVALSPDVSLGCGWPPVGVEPLSYLSVPLLNTMLLLSSGVSITWAHHGLVSSNLLEGFNGMAVTLLLGTVFLVVQVNEYFEAAFCMTDSAFGSFFFLMTGFHGFHVLVGVVFIFVSMLRLIVYHFSNVQHLGFEASAWYWHFVDVVWLLLFVSVYWWGG